jgi:hypothetical protein
MLVTTFDCSLKGEMRTDLHLNRTKEEAEGTAAAAVPASAVLTPKRASQASSAENETTATFDLTQIRDKSNIIYQKLN